MAYLRLGLSREQLAERFRREAVELDEPQLVARFGANPERFLLDEATSDPTRSLFGYNELRASLFVDERGREYARESEAHPEWAYVKLPKSITLRQRQAARDAFSYDDRLDFPQPGERLRLSVIGARRPEHRGQVLERVVERVLFVRQATGVVELSGPLPGASDVPDSTVGRRDEEKEVRSALRRHGLLPEQQQGGVGGEEAEDLRLRYPSVEAAEKRAAKRKRPWRAPRLPGVAKAPTAKRAK